MKTPGVYRVDLTLDERERRRTARSERSIAKRKAGARTVQFPDFRNGPAPDEFVPGPGQLIDMRRMHPFYVPQFEQWKVVERFRWLYGEKRVSDYFEPDGSQRRYSSNSFVPVGAPVDDCIDDGTYSWLLSGG